MNFRTRPTVRDDGFIIPVTMERSGDAQFVVVNKAKGMNNLIEVKVIPPNPLPCRYYNWQQDYWSNIDPHEIHGLRAIPMRYSDGYENGG